MKVRHIRQKPWTRKGPVHRARKKQSRSRRRVAARRYAEILEACHFYLRPMPPPSAPEWSDGAMEITDSPRSAPP